MFTIVERLMLILETFVPNLSIFMVACPLSAFVGKRWGPALALLQNSRLALQAPPVQAKIMFCLVRTESRMFLLIVDQESKRKNG